MLRLVIYWKLDDVMRGNVTVKQSGMVLDHSLFVEYCKYQRNEAHNRSLVNKIMSYYHNGFLTNVGQYAHNGIPIKRNTKSMLANNGLTTQSLEELATLTTYKIILTEGQTHFPFVNINEGRFNPAITTFYKGDEERTAAADYLKNLCKGARKSILLYDKFIKSAGNLADLLRYIIPNKQIQLIVPFNKVDDDCRKAIKETHDKLFFVDLGAVPQHHDRYLIVDESIEVVLTSGFEYLQNQRKEISLVIRPVKDLHGLR